MEFFKKVQVIHSKAGKMKKRNEKNRGNKQKTKSKTANKP